MTVSTFPQHPRLRIAPWSELSRWDVNSGYEISWQWPADVLRPLGAALVRRIVPVEADDLRTVPIIDRISFGGQLFIRPEQERVGYKGRLFWAESGQLVYSKIRVKQGSVLIVPATEPRVAVSNEYPVFSIKPDVALPEYLALMLRSSSFKRLLEGLAHGGSSKTRIAAATLEALPVPLPPLATQQAILDADAAGRAQAAALLAEAAAVEAVNGNELLILLGLPIIPPKAPKQKVQVMSWSKLERWSTRAILDPTIFSGTYPTVQLGSVSAVTYGITKDPTNRPGQNARPYLRVANVQRGELDLREVKTIEVSPSEQERYELLNGDILVCEGNSADLVGRPAIWRDEIPHCIHQNHLLRVRTNSSELLPEFLLAYMNCPQARRYFYARAKYTTNLASINSTDLKALPVPLPPLKIQQSFVYVEQQQAAKSVTLRQQAAQVATEATARVEEMILGNHTIS